MIMTGSVLGPACLHRICLPGSHCPVVGLADPQPSGPMHFMQVDKVPGPSGD